MNTEMVNTGGFPSEFVKLAEISGMYDVSQFHRTMMETIMPGGKQPSDAQFALFVSTANKFKLNPLAKEIYAFPTKGGGIQPIVSIDGWLKIINTHPDFDGMEHEDIITDGKLFAIKCSMYKKNTTRPVVITEYMSECERPTDTWKKWPARMLRHKATIQAGRYAFGISGIIDPDEAERFEDAGAVVRETKDITPEAQVLPEFTQDMLNAKSNKWANSIAKGNDPEDLISMLEAKYSVADDIANQIRNLNEEQAA